MAENRDILLRIRGDSKDAVKSLTNLKTSFTEINQAVELGKSVFRGFQTVLTSTFDGLDQAQKIEGVARGFQTLQTQAGLLADDSLAKLRSATLGLVDDFTLMQQANQAVQLGLDPTNLDIMAEAAVKLGAAVGRTGTEAFGDLITGVGRASPLILDNLGITIKAAEAQERYANELGKSTKDLTENEKAQAFRFAAMQKIVEKSKELADVEINAGQAAEIAQVSFTNLRNEFLQSLNQSTDLRDTFLELADVMRNIDTDALVEGINQIARASLEAIKAVSQFSSEVRFLADTQGAIRDEVLRSERALISSAKTFEDQVDVLRDLQTEYDEATRRLIKNSEEFGTNAKATQIAAGRTEALRTAIDELSRKMLQAELPTKSVTREVENAGKAAKTTTKDFEDMFDIMSQIGRAFDGKGNGFFELAFGDPPSAADVQKALDEFNRAIEKNKEEQIKANKEAADQAADDYKEAYRESVDFFEDILIGAVEGNIEDVFKNMLTRAAVKFGAEILAQLTGAFSAQQLFGGASGALGGIGGQGGGGIGGAIGGTAGSAGVGGAAGGAAGGFSLGGLVPLAAVGGGIFLGNNALGGIQAIRNGQDPNFQQSASTGILGGIGGVSFANSGIASGSALAAGSGFLGLATGGAGFFLPEILDFAGINLGSGKSGEQKQRDAFRSFLQEGGLLDDNFGLSLFGGNSFNFGLDGGSGVQNITDANRQFQGIGAALAGVTGGSGVEGADALFASALASLDDYNTALFATQGLFADLGTSAQAEMQKLQQEFLAGNLSIEEYNERFAGLQEVANFSITSIDDALGLLARNTEGRPIDSLNLLQQTFGLVRESGVQDVESLIATMQERLGGDAGEVFQRMADAGIDQFTDFSQLSQDQIRLLFNELVNLEDEFVNLTSVATKTGEEASQNLGKISDTLKDIISDAKEAQAAIDKVNSGSFTVPGIIKDLNGRSIGAGNGG